MQTKDRMKLKVVSYTQLQLQHRFTQKMSFKLVSCTAALQHLDQFWSRQDSKHNMNQLQCKTNWVCKGSNVHFTGRVRTQSWCLRRFSFYIYTFPLSIRWIQVVDVNTKVFTWSSKQIPQTWVVNFRVTQVLNSSFAKCFIFELLYIQ